MKRKGHASLAKSVKQDAATDSRIVIFRDGHERDVPEEVVEKLDIQRGASVAFWDNDSKYFRWGEVVDIAECGNSVQYICWADGRRSNPQLRRHLRVPISRFEKIHVGAMVLITKHPYYKFGAILLLMLLLAADVVYHILPTRRDPSIWMTLFPESPASTWSKFEKSWLGSLCSALMASLLFVQSQLVPWLGSLCSGLMASPLFVQSQLVPWLGSLCSGLMASLLFVQSQLVQSLEVSYAQAEWFFLTLTASLMRLLITLAVTFLGFLILKHIFTCKHCGKLFSLRKVSRHEVSRHVGSEDRVRYKRNWMGATEQYIEAATVTKVQYRVTWKCDECHKSSYSYQSEMLR